MIIRTLALSLASILAAAPSFAAVGFNGELLARLERSQGLEGALPPSVHGREITMSADEAHFAERKLRTYGSGAALYQKCKDTQYGQTRSDACVAVDIVKRRIRTLTGTNWKMVQAIAFTENRLTDASEEVNTSVKSHADAKGLMQVTKLIWNYFVNSTYENGKSREDGHHVLGPRSLSFDGDAPYGLDNSILVGNAYLTELKGKYCGKTETANCRSLIAAAYNAGETAVNKAGKKVPNFKETRQYVRIFQDKYASVD